MDDIRIRQGFAPITTGLPKGNAAHTPETGTGESFQELLARQIGANGPLFSKHAALRATERGIELSPEKMDRLNEGVRLAEQKGLQEPLILVGGTAFIVSVKNNTVITTVGQDSLTGSVFTNIDGTVIL